MSLRVRLWRSKGKDLIGRCVCCGRLFEPTREVGVLSDFGGTVGDLCPACLELGPLEASREMARHAERLDLIALRMADMDPESWPKTAVPTMAQEQPGDAEILGALPVGSVGALSGSRVTGE